MTVAESGADLEIFEDKGSLHDCMIRFPCEHI